MMSKRKGRHAMAGFFVVLLLSLECHTARIRTNTGFTSYMMESGSASLRPCSTLSNESIFSVSSSTSLLSNRSASTWLCSNLNLLAGLVESQESKFISWFNGTSGTRILNSFVTATKIGDGGARLIADSAVRHFIGLGVTVTGIVLDALALLMEACNGGWDCNSVAVAISLVTGVAALVFFFFPAVAIATMAVLHTSLIVYTFVSALVITLLRRVIGPNVCSYFKSRGLKWGKTIDTLSSPVDDYEAAAILSSIQSTSVDAQSLSPSDFKTSLNNVLAKLRSTRREHAGKLRAKNEELELWCDSANGTGCAVGSVFVCDGDDDNPILCIVM